jgi:hypothetical protein
MRWLVDTEWLGRLNEARVARMHLVESALVGGESREVNRFVGRNSDVCRCSSPAPLVDKTVNSCGGMTKIAGDLEAAAEADLEASEMRRRFGYDPW